MVKEFEETNRQWRIAQIDARTIAAELASEEQEIMSDFIIGALVGFVVGWVCRSWVAYQDSLDDGRDES
jgi:F0F1-type ATP synthase assembly protein I